MDLDLSATTAEFLKDKGFDPDTKEGLEKAKKWVKKANPDDLMLGEGTGDPFDVAMGSIRRGMLMRSIDEMIAAL